MSAAELSELLAAAEKLGCDLSQEAASKLLAYRDLIAKWNKVYNLTALRDPAQMLVLHIIDSLSAVAPLRRQIQILGLPQSNASVRLLDVGSGGGLPGIVLACVMPELAVTCVDTVGKKAAFVQQAAGELGLSQVHGLHARVESLGSEPAYDIITSRAFASLGDFTQLSQHCLATHGIWMALKGKPPTSEIESLPRSIEMFHVEQLQVPELQAERCIVWMQKRRAI